MDYSLLKLKAIKIAREAHAGIVRKDGTPYIDHPIFVALSVSDPVEQIAALLHDVVEDTDWTIERLAAEGFTDEILKIVDAVSKRKGEKYSDFITRIIAAGPGAIRVKLADINHNMNDQSALEPDEARFLKKRYKLAQERLNGSL